LPNVVGVAEAFHGIVTVPAEAEIVRPNATPNAQNAVDNAFILPLSLSFDEGLSL
jgi:hypothetical protein